MKTTHFLGAALSLWLAGVTLAQAGSLYKWVGEDGSVHYSAQSPVLSKSQTIQRLRLHAKASREIMAPDFDSSRNIDATEASLMRAQEEESQHAAAKSKSLHPADGVRPNLQVKATPAMNHPLAGRVQDGSPKTVVDVLTDPVQMQ